ncbi:hypothetical protein E2P60_00750 [Candidatus Bathyarchaeota archaeon]|nr:hypothetical protein E2P60_00750 [Candidatus Bathyarchaeota archaeon]
MSFCVQKETPIGLRMEIVYKSVSIYKKEGEGSLKLKESVQAWLNGALNDPIVKILSKNSQLTKTQLETLLIDVLAENISGKYLKYDEKASLRLTKAKISRGSFNRTLKQSKENVIKSIYTVLLLGYLGVFDSTTLDPYLEIANKLKQYVEAHQDIPDTENELKDHVKVIEIIREELETSLKRLSTPSTEEV